MLRSLRNPFDCASVFFTNRLVGSRFSFCSSSQGGEGPKRRRTGGGSKAGMEKVESGVKKDDAKPEQGNPEDELGPEPEKPLPGDCCGSGCERCVWDVYYDELDEYMKHKKKIEEKSPK